MLENDFIKGQIELARSSVRGSEISAVKINQKNKSLKGESDIVSCLENDVRLAREVVSEANRHLENSKPGSVLNIPQAVRFLGAEKAIDLIHEPKFGLKQSLHKPSEKILSDSVEIAKMSRLVAEQVDGLDGEDAYSCGLFSNIGALTYSVKYGEQYDSYYLAGLANPYSSIIDETFFYGCGHNYVGASVGIDWGLHHNVVKTIMLSHYERVDSIPDDWVRKMTFVVQLSTALVSKAQLDNYAGNDINKIIARTPSILGVQPSF